MKADKQNRKMRRKHGHGGLKFLVVLLVLVVVVLGIGGFAYYSGFGFPTQESVSADMFSANAQGQDIGQYLSGSVSSDKRSEIEAILPVGSGQTEVNGVDRSMASTKVLLTAKLSSGGEQAYTVSLVRDGLSWKVTDVQLSFASQQGSEANNGANAGAAQTGTLATTGA